MKLRVDAAIDGVSAVDLNGVGFQCRGAVNLAYCGAIPSDTNSIGTDLQQIFYIYRGATADIQIGCLEALCSFEKRFSIACAVCR